MDKFLRNGWMDDCLKAANELGSHLNYLLLSGEDKRVRRQGILVK